MVRRGNRTTLLNDLLVPESYSNILEPVLRQRERICPACITPNQDTLSWHAVYNDDGQFIGSEAICVNMESRGKIKRREPLKSKSRSNLATGTAVHCKCLRCDLEFRYTGDLLEGTVFEQAQMPPQPVYRFYSRLVAQRHTGALLSECLNDLISHGGDLYYTEAMGWILNAQEAMAHASKAPLRGGVMGIYLHPSDLVNEWGLANDDIDLVLLAEHRGEQGVQWGRDGETASSSSCNMGHYRLLVLPPRDPAALLDALNGALKSGTRLGLRIRPSDNDAIQQELGRRLNTESLGWYGEAIQRGLTKGLDSFNIRSVSMELRKHAAGRFKASLRRQGISGIPQLRVLQSHRAEVQQSFLAAFEMIRESKRIGARTVEITNAAVAAATETLLREAARCIDFVSTKTEFDESDIFVKKMKCVFKDFMQQAGPGTLRRLFVEFAAEEFAFNRNVRTRCSAEDRLRLLLAPFGTILGNYHALQMLTGRRHEQIGSFGNYEDDLPDLLADELYFAEQRALSSQAKAEGKDGMPTKRKAVFPTYRTRSDLDTGVTAHIYLPSKHKPDRV